MFHFYHISCMAWTWTCVFGLDCIDMLYVWL